MALLKSTKDIPGVDFIDYRDSTYYNKYNYRARVNVKGLRRGFYYEPEEFEEKFNKNKLWGRMTDEEKQTIRQNLPEIKACLQFRIDNKKNKQVTIRMEGNTMAVFHNDLDFLHKTFDGLVGATVDYSQAETAGYAGIKLFVNEPKYKYRIYLKSKRVPDGFRDGMSTILANNKQLKPSGAFKDWLREDNNRGWWWTNYASANHFIDYNDESYLSYLSLMYGEYFGKKYKLEKRPDPV